MYTVSQAYITAIDTGAQQYIRGTLTLASGTVIPLSDDNIFGTPRTDQRCTSSDDTFMFGEMYVGTLDITLYNITILGDSYFHGAQISLEVGIDVGETDPEWVPLGLWDITSSEKLNAQGQVRLKGADRLNRLKAAINDDTVGVLRLATIMEKVEKTAFVTFEQTPAEVAALIGRPAQSIRCVEFSANCWEEVRQIAQIMGGFAFANREGKIEFRKFGMFPVRTIEADRRFGLRPSLGLYGAAQIRYTDSKGRTVKADTAGAGTASLGFSCNKYIFTGSDNYIEQYSEWIEPIAAGFTSRWHPGTCDYYGDPALDLGDMITVEDGIAGQSGMQMLVTGLSWGFRAPQTITSAGLSDTGDSTSSGSSGSSSGSGGSSSQVAAPTMNTIALDTFPGDFEGRYTSAEGAFGIRQAADCFVNVGIVMTAEADGTLGFRVLLDEIAQVLQPVQTVNEGDTVTLSAAVPISPDEGKHTLRVETIGNGTITEISAVVVGQDISPESPDIVPDSVWTYTITDGAATVTGYSDESTYPRIPDTLGGVPVRIIGAGTFTGTAVKNVYIPEGVEEIQ